MIIQDILSTVPPIPQNQQNLSLFLNRNFTVSSCLFVESSGWELIGNVFLLAKVTQIF